MAKLLNWLKSASARLIDPNRAVILAEQSRRLEELLYQNPGGFQLDTLSTALGIFPEDVPAICVNLYRRAAERAWKDQVVTEKERRSLDKIARLLKIPYDDQRQIELSIGLEVFERALSAVTADGVVDHEDGRRLTSVAASLQTTTRDLVLNYFADQGEAIVRAMFAAITEDGVLDQQEWDRLLYAAQSLGLDKNDIATIVRAQAQPFVEHVLAEAKADGKITQTEREKLAWLVSNLKLPTDFRLYLQSEVARLDLFSAIAEGRLPAVECRDAGLRAGEIAHHRTRAVYQFTRQFKTGPRYDQIDGELLITDSRIIFSSPAKTLDLNHRRIVSVVQGSQSIEIRSTSKGSGNYFPSNPALTYAILRVAIGRANQTIVASSGDTPARHIPREVRQRVWQLYGGRCAECGSTQYLEFDHIIPHARGGNNSDNNVQLLCRGCNAKKSDHI
jgi:hypothetical protein